MAKTITTKTIADVREVNKKASANYRARDARNLEETRRLARERMRKKRRSKKVPSSEDKQSEVPAEPRPPKYRLKETPPEETVESTLSTSPTLQLDDLHTKHNSVPNIPVLTERQFSQSFYPNESPSLVRDYPQLPSFHDTFLFPTSPMTCGEIHSCGNIHGMFGTPLQQPPIMQPHYFR
ncbi:hypothetical protein VNI00_012429 [Paramarasmius palmivorus]|uniref:BZIP domain-containing protein n=1 Tax=Paramarasmius palmivorus TaxID=297713 RepID=A0AAW0C5Y1_9AGAR